MTPSSKPLIASRAVAASDKIIRLRVPSQTLNRRRLAEAEVVIDKDGMVIKNQFGPEGRQATQDELDRAVEVYG